MPDGATPPSTGDSTTGIVDVTFRLPDAVTSEASDEVSCSGDTCVSSTDDAFGSCGDGVLAATEECDDGNRAPGDGCSPFCRKEATWFDCRVPGQLCVSTLACGDGKVQGGEFCDDRNTVPGDGCSETCAIEEGFACDKEGELCVKVASQFCGDGHLNATDQCDDGNATAGDGCTSCRIDQGYTCPTPGQPCVLDEYCGDNKVNGPVGSEACDDGNLAPGDGCDGTCKVERWWRCPPTGGACVSAIECGNGELEPGEACDDKNKAADDGCAADCKTVEPGWICNTAGAPCVKATEPVCGDGLLASWEQCDDGNTKADVDGCTADCTVLPGWRCDAPGMACAKIAFCGDGAINLDLGERCDDKNDADGDGCNKSCQVESGWKCLEAGKPCIRDGVCGDGRLHAGELCDDGNVANGDGCSADCKTVSPGWFCPTPGRLCMAEKCGDSIRAGLEQCDDGNELGTDGCNKYCQVEPGYTCTAGATKDVCTRVPQTCGNGTKEGTEQCDDNNLRPYDGCSETCTSEPRCGYGADGTYGCPATCGDGMRYITEACDDGNTQDGDGCSKDCKIESGWACNDTTGTSSPASLTLPIVFRDFMPSLGTPVLPSVAAGTGECAKDANRSPAGCVVRGHPHFEVNPFDQNVLWRGLVAPQLDGSGKPTYNTAYSGAQNVLAGNRRWTPAGLTGGVFTTANTRCGGEQAALNLSASDISSFFSLWYRDDGRYNYRVDSTLTLNRQTDGSYVFSAGTDSAPWMPLNGRGFGNLTYCGDSTRVGNFGFTSEVRYWFTFQGTGQESFSFYGDDDVWVFVNGQLVVDIGGIHGQVNGSVTLTPTGNATAEVDTAPGVRGTATTIPLGLQLGGLYEIAIFQAERQAYGSNYKLTLRGFNAPRSQCNTVCGIQPPAIMTPIVTPDEQCDLGSANAGTGANTPYDGCTTTCNLGPRCGDKSVQTAAGETCDNGINADFRVASAAETVGKCGPGCKAPSYCGDNSVDTAFGEQCDKGAENSDTAYGPGMCKTNCTLAARCGDGKPDLASGEQCDTGINNGTPSSICDIECKLKCGNGKPDAGEECDNGAALNVGGYNGCTSVCKKGPFCGDGKTDLSAGEVCDDGRNDGTYGTCGKGCTVRAPYCGDGVPDLAAGEACDKGANNSATAYGRDQCTNRCRLAPYCGDKQVNGTEGCDDGVNSGLPGSCTVDCKSYVPLTSCGDGSVQPPEQCDFGRAVNGTQASTCDARCRTKCGNGILDPGEICDEGDNTGAYGHCAPGCVLGGYCGDGVPNGPEQCDLGTQNQANPYGRNLCTVQCTTAPFCGDGRIQAERGEECDSSPGCDSACKKIIAILR